MQLPPYLDVVCPQYVFTCRWSMLVSCIVGLYVNCLANATTQAFVPERSKGFRSDFWMYLYSWVQIQLTAVQPFFLTHSSSDQWKLAMPATHLTRGHHCHHLIGLFIRHGIDKKFNSPTNPTSSRNSSSSSSPSLLLLVIQSPFHGNAKLTPPAPCLES